MADLFTFLNQIQNKQRTVPYDKKTANAYMLSMWLSHDKDLIEKVNKINQYQFLLPDEIIYEYYMDSIPSGKRYIKWIKKRKADNKLKKRIDKLQEKYPELSTRECKMIITSLETKCKEKINEDKY
jgi:hypothetical protein